jgi:hypothetical protein
MGKPTVIYEENSILNAKFYHPKSDDFLVYKAKISIKESGKTPVQMDLEFAGIPPFAAPMPPKEHVIKAESVIDLAVKIRKWLKKYGYELL